ncbi:MAG: HAD hydrolase-like protein [Anaerolineae bacterium]|nr:HAD hydrolase-like protein [Anaerolineae bacterium]
MATNSDATLPSEEGELPGAGAPSPSCTAATGVEPTVVGKPQVAMFEQALARLGIIPAQAIMVGDRVETDIVGGQAAGLRTIGVLSGVSSAAAFAQTVPPPTWVFDSVAEINLALFE